MFFCGNGGNPAHLKKFEEERAVPIGFSLTPCLSWVFVAPDRSKTDLSVWMRRKTSKTVQVPRLCFTPSRWTKRLIFDFRINQNSHTPKLGSRTRALPFSRKISRQHGQVEARLFFRRYFHLRRTAFDFFTMKAKIIVTPKKAVVDPQGKTVQSALEQMGYRGVKAVHVGKYLEIELDGTDKEAARQQLNEAAHKFLSNPVIEDYKLEIE
jgi:phosphoribosylformylglycinamidine synthase